MTEEHETTKDTPVKPMSTEAGYQNLNTAFTGTTCPELSGNELFPFTAQDSGVAGSLSSKELM